MDWESEGPKDSDEHERSPCWTESTPVKEYRLDRYGRERMYIDLQWLEEKGCIINMYLYTRTIGLRIRLARNHSSHEYPRAAVFEIVKTYTDYCSGKHCSDISDRALRPQRVDLRIQT